MKSILKNFNLHVSVLIFLFLSFSIIVEAQNKWTISKCVEYALKNNIDLKITKNKVTRQNINLKESRTNLLPNLNIGTALTVNFGRSIDGNTNDITYNQTATANHWISSSFDLFQAFLKQNTISYNKYLLNSCKQDVKLAKNKLIFNILTNYYTLYYTKELVNVAKKQVRLSNIQLYRVQQLVKVGKESQVKVVELKSQWMSDNLNLTRAKNNMNKSLVALKQTLKINMSDTFVLDSINEPFILVDTNINTDSIYNLAVNVLPEIKQKEISVLVSKKDLSIAKSKIYPRLYVSAGLNTYFFDGDNLSYPNQMNNNFNQQINIGVSIPILNSGSVYNIKRKKLAVYDSKLQLAKQKDNLYSEIWNAINQLKSSKDEYKASQELLKLSELTLKMVTKKLEKGIASTTDYEVAKQRFANASANMIKAKITFIMHSQIIEFYKTGNWNHLK